MYEQGTLLNKCFMLSLLNSAKQLTSGDECFIFNINLFVIDQQQQLLLKHLNSCYHDYDKDY